ncbi:MAG: sulfite oxidase [Coriobacteriia bacterium]|nr:sulfite oxidase [Coriobacteriia bacterium]MBS5479400.1 sulfite oxidase [Coriobacteriia bacterium]
MIGTIAGRVGQQVTVQGYAQDFTAPIARMLFSADGGATWAGHATEGADLDRNVNWSFSFTPPEAGDYELLIRAESADGRLTPEAGRVHIKVALT